MNNFANKILKEMEEKAKVEIEKSKEILEDIKIEEIQSKQKKKKEIKVEQS